MARVTSVPAGSDVQKPLQCGPLRCRRCFLPPRHCPYNTHQLQLPGAGQECCTHALQPPSAEAKLHISPNAHKLNRPPVALAGTNMLHMATAFKPWPTAFTRVRPELCPLLLYRNSGRSCIATHRPHPIHSRETARQGCRGRNAAALWTTQPPTVAGAGQMPKPKGRLRRKMALGGPIHVP